MRRWRQVAKAGLAVEFEIRGKYYKIAGMPNDGRERLHPDGTIRFTPGPDFLNQVVLNYQLKDPEGAVSNVARITISSLCVLTEKYDSTTVVCYFDKEKTRISRVEISYAVANFFQVEIQIYENSSRLSPIKVVSYGPQNSIYKRTTCSTIPCTFKEGRYWPYYDGSEASYSYLEQTTSTETVDTRASVCASVSAYDPEAFRYYAEGRRIQKNICPVADNNCILFDKHDYLTDLSKCPTYEMVNGIFPFEKGDSILYRLLNKP
jgi:hypothetical protein